jgi:hypothetical protein
MFLDEARVAARIRHANVAPTLDVVATEHDPRAPDPTSDTGPSSPRSGRPKARPAQGRVPLR